MAPPGKTLSFELPLWVDSAARARTVLRSWLDPFAIDEAYLDDAALVLTELVTNAVKHASPGAANNIRVELTVVWDMLHLVVTDSGPIPQPPQVLTGSSTSVNGRGHALLEGLAQDWWWEVTAGEPKVHATMLLNAHGRDA